MRQFSITLPISIFKEDKAFIAYTPLLDVSTAADTLGEVKQRFAELVRIFFEELDKKGTTDEVLTSLGWTRIDSKWSPPAEVEHSNEIFNVPMRA